MRLMGSIALMALGLVLAALIVTSCKASADAPSSQPTVVGGAIAAPTVQVPPPDAVKGTWSKVREALKAHHYREVVGLVILLVVAGWRRYAFGFVLHRLSSWWQGFMVCLFAFLGVAGTNLAAQNFDVGSFIVDTVLASGEAMLLWQMLLKRLPWFKVPDPGGGAAVPPPAAVG